jgi:hypothetical protein
MFISGMRVVSLESGSLGEQLHQRSDFRIHAWQVTCDRIEEIWVWLLLHPFVATEHWMPPRLTDTL